MTDALLKPFYQIVTAPPRQWHPLLVHFPIVFLTVEALLLGLWRLTGKPAHEPLAYACLHLSLWTMLIVAVTGVHDAGLDLGAGNPLWLGLRDRWQQACSLAQLHHCAQLAGAGAGGDYSGATALAQIRWPGRTAGRARLGIRSGDSNRLMDFDRRRLRRRDDQSQMNWI